MRKLNQIISSNVFNYQSILLNHFEAYLANIGSSVKTQKNYRSDVRHLFTWISLETRLLSQITISKPEHLCILLSPGLLAQYRQSLIDSSTPRATINRRLSSIRIFFQCLKHLGFISDNPAISLSNVLNHPIDENYQEAILRDFEKNLITEGASKKTIANYISDVKQFLSWLDPMKS